MYHKISTAAFNCRTQKQGLSHRERSLQKVTCPQCGAIVSGQYLKTHNKTAKCRQNATLSLPALPLGPIPENLSKDDDDEEED